MGGEDVQPLKVKGDVMIRTLNPDETHRCKRESDPIILRLKMMLRRGQLIPSLYNPRNLLIFVGKLIFPSQGDSSIIGDLVSLRDRLKSI